MQDCAKPHEVLRFCIRLMIRSDSDSPWSIQNHNFMKSIEFHHFCNPRNSEEDEGICGFSIFFAQSHFFVKIRLNPYHDALISYAFGACRQKGTRICEMHGISGKSWNFTKFLVFCGIPLNFVKIRIFAICWNSLAQDPSEPQGPFQG